MNAITKSLLMYFNQDSETSSTIMEIYRSSIDDYTFMLALKYFVQDPNNFPKEFKSFSGGRSINWNDEVLYYKTHFQKFNLEYGKILFSFYQSKFLQDKKIAESKKYSLIPITGTNSSLYKIVLKKHERMLA